MLNPRGGRTETYFHNPTAIPVIILMFLIFSSSVYPAILSEIKNNEVTFIATALARVESANIDTSNHHSSIPTSQSPTPTIITLNPITSAAGFSDNSDKDLTAQAALSGVWARQTNNIVGAQSYYDIVFVTSTTGTIKFIDITFPAGILIGAPPRLVEREGIGAGNAVKESSNKISYTVLAPKSIPENTKIRLEFFNLVNPILPSTGYKIMVTTKNADGTIIDGPTISNGLNMKQISTGQIADNAVTSSKIAEGTVGSNDLDPALMISRFLRDDTSGNSFGWNPNGMETNFIIFDEAIEGSNAVLINVGDTALNSQCEALGSLTGFFTIQCNTAPPQGSELRYTITNLPLS